MRNKEELLTKIKKVKILKAKLQYLQTHSRFKIVKFFYNNVNKANLENEITYILCEIAGLKQDILQVLIKNKEFSFVTIDYDLLEKWIS